MQTGNSEVEVKNKGKGKGKNKAVVKKDKRSQTKKSETTNQRLRPKVEQRPQNYSNRV